MKLTVELTTTQAWALRELATGVIDNGGFDLTRGYQKDHGYNPEQLRGAIYQTDLCEELEKLLDTVAKA